MSFVVNKLFQWHDDSDELDWTERIIYVDSNARELATIDIRDPSALPLFRSFEEMSAAIEERTALPLETDGFSPLRLSEHDLESPRYRTFKKRRDKAFKIIAPLFEGNNTIKMLFERDRATLIETRAKEISSWPKGEKASPRTIYVYCRRWWQGGQTPNALLPHYDNCGAKRGKTRTVTKKLGRKSRITTQMGVLTGANMREDWLKTILLGGKLFYERRKNPSFRKAYRQTLARFFIKDKVIEDGREKIILPDPNAGEVFSFGQFRYHYLQNRDFKQALFKRVGAKRYNLRHRELLGNSKVPGPGSLYQVDATIADVYLISRYGGFRLVGRPVIWVVIDVYSRMIVGFCIRLEGEGWLGLQLALENATADKVSFCAKYGIEISDEIWPSRYLPEHLTGDRGPLISANADRFIYALNIQVSNTPPYRPDWKGIVEQIFNQMNIRVLKWLPGAVEHDWERGDKDYRHAAVLDIQQLNEIMIEAILYHNNEHLVSDGYELDPDLIAAKVKAYPVQLYHWGVQHKSGHLRERDTETIRFNLLPESRATITKQGIRFKHPKSSCSLDYTCDQGLLEGWLLRNTGTKARQFKAVYDPRWNSEIYLDLGDGRNSITCRLKNPNSPHFNRDWSEVIQYHESNQLQREILAPAEVQAGANLDRRIQTIVSEGQRRANERKLRLPNQSNSAFLSATRSNRQREVEAMHAEEAGLGSHTKEELTSAKNTAPSTGKDDGNYIGLSPVTNIAELRKKRIGK
jgi:transposase InsO family protein